MRRTALTAASLALFLLLWVGVAMAFPKSVPSVGSVGAAALEAVFVGDFVYHASRTLLRVLGGFGLAFLAAGIIGYLMGRFELAEAAVRPWIIVGLTVPSLVWAMLAVIWFKISELAPVIAVTGVLIPVLVQNVWQSTKALDPNLTEMSWAFGVREVDRYRHVVAPQLVPGLLASARYGISLAWKVTVIAEMFGLSNGVGYQINYMFGLLRMDGVLAWTGLFAAIIGLIEYGLLYPLERHITKWRRG